jgi:hypothetical protein
VNLKLKPGSENRAKAIGYGHVKESERLTAMSIIDKNELLG